MLSETIGRLGEVNKERDNSIRSTNLIVCEGNDAKKNAFDFSAIETKALKVFLSAMLE